MGIVMLGIVGMLVGGSLLILLATTKNYDVSWIVFAIALFLSSGYASITQTRKYIDTGKRKGKR